MSDKFYGIMINTNAFKHFRASYKQFMAYTRDIKNTIINILKVGAIYILFRINSILFIKSMLIQILIEYIKFYIIKANTLFLLYFIDID